jgi:hypothetical protein
VGRGEPIFRVDGGRGRPEVGARREVVGQRQRCICAKLVREAGEAWVLLL